MANSQKTQLLLQPTQASMDILVQEHADGTWIETGNDSWAVLNDDELDKLINTLVEIRNKRNSKESQI